MIISRLDLKAFGHFTDVSIDLHAAGDVAPPHRCFHIIYGRNESGKSTSLRAITSLLFGMPHISEDNFLHANAQLRVGGLLVDERGNSLECVRRRGRKATLRDATDSDPVDESVLQAMLGGMNREMFLTRHGLSHDELVAGGAAIVGGEGDLGQILFSAGAGIGKLREIQRDLDEAASRLFTPRGSKTSINAALREIEQQRKELREAQIPPVEFSDLRQRITQKRAVAGELNAQIHSVAASLSRLRNYQQAAPLLPAWRMSIETLQSHVATPLLDEAFTERRRQAASDREVAISRQVELENRVAELTVRLETLPVDAVVMNHETEVQAVFQEVAARDKADRDRLELIRVQRNVDRRIIELLREFSIEIQNQDPDDRAEEVQRSIDRLHLSDALRNRIRDLASTHERLIGRRNDASDAVETTKRRLADAVQELESLGTPSEPASLSGAIEAVGDPQAMLEAIAAQQESCDSIGRRLEQVLRRLEGFGGSAQQAAGLRLPEEATIGERLADLKTAQQHLQTSQQQLMRLRKDRDEIEQQILRQQTQLPLPTIEELGHARERRDRATDRVADLVRANPVDAVGVADAIEQLRQFNRLADQMADTMRAHHEQVHKRSTLAARASALESQIEQAEGSAAVATESVSNAESAWLEVWSACGIKAGPPERMLRWLADHEQLCELASALGDQQKRLEQTRSRADRAATRLRTVLASARSGKPVSVASTFQGGLFDEPAEDDLIALYDEAVALRSESMRARQQLDAVSRRRDELAEELPQAETRFEAAQQSVEAWRQEWQRATESFSGSKHIGTREVLQMLDQIADLCNKRRERDILTKRIQSIGEDELAYDARVQRLAAATGHANRRDLSIETSDGEVPSSTAVAQSLYQRLQAERTSVRGRETLRDQIESTRQRLAEATAQRTASEAVLDQLCKEAGCESADQLPAVERAARERLRIQSDLRDLENQLSILAGDQPFEEFIDTAGRQQPAVLEVEIENQESQLGQLRRKLAAVQEEIGALGHEFSLMDGSSRASELGQSIQLTAGQISRDAEEYARVKIASLILAGAIDHYRKAHQSPVLALANEFFAQLTCGKYTQLRPDYDAKGRTTLFGICGDGTAVPANAMSSGTADALYLALRLASLQHQATRGPSIPLIVDDCLVQLDDDRVVAALKAFSELSRQTQVILFTHHGHLVSLARQSLEPGEFHIHELGG